MNRNEDKNDNYLQNENYVVEQALLSWRCINCIVSDCIMNPRSLYHNCSNTSLLIQH